MVPIALGGESLEPYAHGWISIVQFGHLVAPALKSLFLGFDRRVEQPTST
jgi:hypothetical protein